MVPRALGLALVAALAGATCARADWLRPTLQMKFDYVLSVLLPTSRIQPGWVRGAAAGLAARARARAVAAHPDYRRPAAVPTPPPPPPAPPRRRT